MVLRRELWRQHNLDLVEKSRLLFTEPNARRFLRDIIILERVVKYKLLSISLIRCQYHTSSPGSLGLTSDAINLNSSIKFLTLIPRAREIEQKPG